MRPPKIAIVADWIIGGGAERVINELHKLYPEAPIYASYCSEEWRERLDGKVVTGSLQHQPFKALRRFAGLITPFRVRWYRSLNFNNFDIVISTTGNGDAKHIKTQGRTKHICYCFTPVHYFWRHYDDYLKNPGFGLFNGLARIGLRLLVKPLRSKDFAAAQTPHTFVAISNHIQADIKEYYGRESVVIAPPVNVERFLDSRLAKDRKGFITVGRQTAYKRIDLIVDACSQANLSLTVVGRGPEHDQLVRRAGPTVTFLDKVSDKALPELMATHQAFLFASVEDFGVAPVEAMAAGLPVIAYRSGGALDYIQEGKSGMFFDKQTVESLSEALRTFSSDDFSATTIRTIAKTFSAERFAEEVTRLVNKVTRNEKR